MKLSGIEIKNYRSIGETGIKLSPLRKCNIIIGKNNVGKSNISSFFLRINQLEKVNRADLKFELDHIERHHLNDQALHSFGLEFKTEENDITELKLSEHDNFIFTFEELRNNNNIMNLRSLDFKNQTNIQFVNELLASTNTDISLMKIDENSRNIQIKIRNIRDALFSHFFYPQISPVKLIPEFRQITYGGRSNTEYKDDGTNMIQRLAEEKSPSAGESKEKFLKIERFVKNILDMPDIELAVSEQEPRVITLQKGSQIFGLESYGTGTHELILIVTAIVLGSPDVMWCIEEPEIHMHPSLQRKFIDFLITQTENDYIITTHSPTLINIASELPEEHHEAIQIFHIEKVNDETIGHPVLNDTDSLTAIADLGFRASDILQSNCVIWVEGPSDRIYLKHWLSLVASELREGFHFTIMLYGGSLGTHLSVDRDYPDQFIDILHINQNTIFMMDSDKNNPDTSLSEYKQRIQEECKKGTDNIAWVTDGRETENYIPASVISTFLSEQRNSDILATFGLYDRLESSIKSALEQNDVQSFDYSTNKVGYSKKIIKHIAKEDIPENLNSWLEKIVEKIKIWNHLENSD